jgi:hypothetical protein
MEQVKLEVLVPKEVHELGAGLVKFVGAMKQALKDGFQPGMDIPVIIATAMNDLIPAFDGIDKVGGELAADKAGFAKALGLSLADLVEAVAKK